MDLAFLVDAQDDRTIGHAVPGGEIWEVPDGAQGGWYVNKDPDGFHTEFDMGSCTNTTFHDTCSGGFALSVEVLRAYVRAEKTAAVARAVANSNGFFRHNVQESLIEVLTCDGSSIAERIGLPVATRFSELSS